MFPAVPGALMANTVLRAFGSDTASGKARAIKEKQEAFGKALEEFRKKAPATKMSADFAASKDDVHTLPEDRIQALAQAVYNDVLRAFAAPLKQHGEQA